ncbi:MAG TPA: hypothetical protein PLC07_07095 [Bacillota bacterium]|nr:hypothetical protein [Bacillota bacterium]HPT88283.1 hypothetical protein [Bacillota bacterium]
MKNIAIEQSEPVGQDHLYPPPQEIKRLYEIAQHGASASLNSLRQFLGSDVDINLHCLSLLTLPVLIDRIRLFYQNHLGFHLRYSGEITGEIYTFFAGRDAKTLIDKMLGHKRFKYGKRFNRIEISVLTELVNIVTNAFWRALTDKTGMNWYLSPPTLINDLSRTLFYSSKIYTVDYFLVHFEYVIPVLDVRIQCIVLPTQQTLARIFSKLTPDDLPELSCSRAI